jgi:hypothetical protein
MVLKLVSPDVAHKSDVGGVRLDLSSDAEVERAFGQIVSSAAGARVSGVLVAEQVPGGLELIVGVSQDPHFGPVVLVGLGGVLVAVLDQVAVALPPLSTHAARRLLQAFPGNSVLRGSRGQPPADVESVINVLQRVGELALDGNGVLRELDLNPLIVGPAGAGCKVVDARLALITP